MTKETIDKVIAFRDDRDWKQYHNGKDLAISISLEANELLEIFQCSKDDCDRPERVGQVKEELADVLIYAIMMSDYYNLDLDEIIDAKLIKNLAKYPKDKVVNLKTK